MASWLLDDQLVDRLIQSDSVSVNVTAETKPRIERYACGKRKARHSMVPWEEGRRWRRTSPVGTGSVEYVVDMICDDLR